VTLNNSSIIAWSLDGTRIAVGHQNDVKIFDALTGHEILTYMGHSQMTVYQYVNAIAWSPNERRIISASHQEYSNSNSILQIWDTSTGENIITHQSSLGWVNSLEWSPDGKRIAVAFRSGKIQVWSAS